MAGNASIKKVVQAHIDLATYKKRLYGVPFTPDDSVLLYNKALFKAAGLDAEKPPATSGEIVSAARKIRALGPDVYGFYFSGSCPGCNIFTIAPQMWAARGTVVLPAGCDAEPLQGESIKQVLQDYRTMWKEGLIPESAKADPGDHSSAVFMSGKIGMQAADRRGRGGCNRCHPSHRWQRSRDRQWQNRAGSPADHRRRGRPSAARPDAASGRSPRQSKIVSPLASTPRACQLP